MLTAIILPLSLAVMMFGVGTSLSLADFKRVFIYPKAVAIGIVGQIILLPLLGFFFASQFGLSPELAVGVMVIVACAGGATSNMIVYLARGDVALSISLTAINSCITVFTIPLVVNYALNHFMGTSTVTELPVGITSIKLFAITLVPVMIGMLVRYFWTGFAVKIETPMNRLITLLFILIVIAVFYQARGDLQEYLASVGPVTYFLNLTAMIMGVIVAAVFHLNEQQTTTIGVEVGIQNSATGIFVAAVLLDNPEVAIVAVIYALAMNLNIALYLMFKYWLNGKGVLVAR
ncbi:bile acid:sodium symporter family protein [Alkalimarinus sediminis]|uniref:Bile acid:sodium symporter family protein n=1 Tax=Alkalimarinus sediminis TaxID=1632866 RepID=A0A9E8HNX5_9ALTE|nr:bile acid:sodium symporter family protein [Alkalimarinus sediminis]UZW76411.1 bile acid:sodium symporter family protein [Alkalimarinus sediminis]